MQTFALGAIMKNHVKFHFHSLFILIIILLLIVSCQTKVSFVPQGLELDLHGGKVEAGGRLPLSVYLSIPDAMEPISLEWSIDRGEILKTRVENEVIFVAPPSEGDITIQVKAQSGDQVLESSGVISVLSDGALKTTVDIKIEVDTHTLTGVFVDKEAPSESFTPPLSIKGTFHYNPAEGTATAGGNWQNFQMYDDGTHGDATADDGIWTLAMEFEKSSEKVYFAFDEGSQYRVQWESGLAWRLKSAWIGLDDFPNDNSNPAFMPDQDRVLRWTADMAETARIYQEGGAK